MSYDSKHVKILSAKDWYNLAFEKYGDYHSYLDWFDKSSFSRFLPRSKKKIRLIDLWAWDGRLYKFFWDLDIAKYVACDISEKILKKHPGKIEKVVCDLESPLPFWDNVFDLAVCFFVIEHLADIELFFDEVYRIIEDGWVFVLGYFFQRRSFLWKIDNENFRIKIYNHRVEDILKFWKKSGFETDSFPVHEKWNLIWHVFVFEK